MRREQWRPVERCPRVPRTWRRGPAPSQFYGQITRRFPLHLPSARFQSGDNLTFSQNAGTDLAEPRSVAPRSQSVITSKLLYGGVGSFT